MLGLLEFSSFDLNVQLGKTAKKNRTSFNRLLTLLERLQFFGDSWKDSIRFQIDSKWAIFAIENTII
ncbi:hypothetical protein WN51_00852 [Melipona quadrifasciata]|uniref:Uncharacterized protein n=1 Tax=Melipona quadrifasciata TaxID=166423 RepID=A0A0N0BKQ8_9HYME|nr:hypothetical protein WN51_00852 [Melipona quadrifasciata]